MTCGPRRGVASIGDAVGDADRAEAAAGDEETAVRREPVLDRREPLTVANLVLRAVAGPAEDAREERRARDAQECTELALRRRDERVVTLLEALGIAAAAEEASKERVTRGCTSWPFRGDPRAGHQGRPLDPRHDEPAAAQRMCNL
jgi:hypothetical protein